MNIPLLWLAIIWFFGIQYSLYTYCIILYIIYILWYIITLIIMIHNNRKYNNTIIEFIFFPVFWFAIFAIFLFYYFSSFLEKVEKFLDKKL